MNPLLLWPLFFLLRPRRVHELQEDVHAAECGQDRFRIHFRVIYDHCRGEGHEKDAQELERVVSQLPDLCFAEPKEDAFRLDVRNSGGRFRAYCTLVGARAFFR